MYYDENPRCILDLLLVGFSLENLLSENEENLIRFLKIKFYYLKYMNNIYERK